MGIIQLASTQITVNEGSGSATLNLVRQGNLDNGTVVSFTTLPGTAKDGQDYIGNLSGRVTFNPGDSLKTIKVSLINDAIAEADEQFSVATGDLVNIFQAPGQPTDEAGSSRTALITIKDDDISTESTVDFRLSNFNVLENQGVAEIVITKKLTDTPATVKFQTVDDYAKSVTTKPQYKDYTGVTTTLSFAPQQTVKTLTIPIINDNLSETDERFKLILSDPVGTTLGLRSTATVTIGNDDPLPGIFTKEVIVNGLSKPTGFAWGVEGDMYITEVGGKVKVFDGATKKILPTPFIDLSPQVNIAGQRGLLSFTIDPQFPTRPYLYLGYTYDSPEEVAKDGPDSDNNRRTNRLVRITADVNTNYTTAVPGSEVVLMKVDNSANFHASGGLGFGKDGSLFWAHGDGTVVAAIIGFPPRFVDLNYPFGKLYRINPDNGNAYPDNPFYDPAKPDSYRSKVYNSGFRNPFRLTVHPTTGQPYIGDVGWDNWEEVNTGRGKNFGWPFYEGANGESVRTGAYANDPELQTIYNTIQVTAPLYAKNHLDGYKSMIVGDFYDSNVYPSMFRDSLFIADFQNGYIEALNFDTTGTKVENSIMFDKPAQTYPIQLSVGPDGYLYGANYQLTNANNGSIIRWVYNTKAPNITIADALVQEGNSGTTTARFVVNLSKTTTDTVRVNFTTVNRGAISPTDFVATNGIITFAPGTTSRTINVTVNGDTVVENNETFLVTLSNASGGAITANTGVGIIINDDSLSPVLPKITIGNTSVLEGDTDRSIARFLVSLDRTSTQPVIVNYNTANQTASSPSDYIGKIGKITFAPGATRQTIYVSVIGDTVVESNETFVVNLTNPVNGIMAVNTGIATIINNDTLPTISVGDTSIIEQNSGISLARFSVTLSKPSTQTITASYTTGNQTAVSPDDYIGKNYQITFAPGATRQTIFVSVKGDTLVESNETFNVRLTILNNVAPGDITGVATIINDDLTKNTTISSKSRSITIDDRPGSINSQSTQKVFIDGLTPPDVFATNLNVSDI